MSRQTTHDATMPAFIFDLMLELAKHLKGKGISDINVINIARDTIGIVESNNRGAMLYFAHKFHTRDRADFCEILAEQLKLKGLHDIEAQQLSEAVTNKVFEAYAGEMFYFPKQDNIDRADRDAQIVKEYILSPSYQTVKKIIRKYGVSQSRVYTIIRIAGEGRGKGYKRERLRPLKVKEPREKGTSVRAKRNAEIVAEYLKEPKYQTIKRLASTHNLDKSWVRRIICAANGWNKLGG